MKVNTNKKNKSASRKLVPAVAMLTTSAVMLSSATYAWFTLNKEVEVTGLQMAATTGDSLEITLGSLGRNTTNAGTISTATPNNTSFGTIDDLGWGRSQTIDSYYSVIGKIKPASSFSALSIFKISEKGVYAGGRAVKNDTTVSASATSDMPTIKLDATYNKTGEELTNDETLAKSRLGENASTFKEGYYVDIPMWIRTSNSESRPLNAYVKITDPTKEDVNNTGSELINAVRVALIPTGQTDALADPTESEPVLPYAPNATLTPISQDSQAIGAIFGLTSTTYNSKVLNNVGTDYSSSLSTGNPTITQAADTFNPKSDINPTFNAKYATNTNVAAKAICNMPAAQKDKYSAVLVIARVWIEGESTYCNDATANQDWNIDFHFELGDATSSGNQG